MILQMWIVIGVLAATFGVIATEKVRPDLAALGACCALLVFGVLSPADVFPVFGSEAIITVGAMFVLSAALERTGVIESASRLLQRFPLRTEWLTLMLLLPPVFAMSAFVNNTPVVVVFLPIVVTLAKRHRLAASKLLIPLSFASILGGSTTLIGTSTNLVASSAGVRSGLAPITMFELTPVALVLAAVALVYLFVLAPRLLPRRETMTSLLDGVSEREFLTEAFVPVGSAVIGKTPDEAITSSLQRGRVLQVIREGKTFDSNLNEVRLAAGDRLRVRSDAAGLTGINERHGLQIQSPSADLAFGNTQENRLVECVVGPQSRLSGRSIAEAEVRTKHGILVLALHRRGENLRDQLTEIPLRSGDVLLIEASESAISALRQGNDLLVLAGGQRRFRRHKRWIASFGVVALSAFQLLTVPVAALLAAVVVVATNCVDSEEAYRAIDWPCLFLIAGMLTIGLALEKTSTASHAAQRLVPHIAPLGPWAALSLWILATSILTNFLTNNAVAALLIPLAVETAHLLHTNPRAFLIGVTLGASACFATPIGYQTNTLVFTAGGYRFSDFLRVGLPLNALHWIGASFLIPYFWPL